MPSSLYSSVFNKVFCQFIYNTRTNCFIDYRSFVCCIPHELKLNCFSLSHPSRYWRQNFCRIHRNIGSVTINAVLLPNSCLICSNGIRSAEHRSSVGVGLEVLIFSYIAGNEKPFTVAIGGILFFLHIYDSFCKSILNYSHSVFHLNILIWFLVIHLFLVTFMACIVHTMLIKCLVAHCTHKVISSGKEVMHKVC